MPQSPSVEIPKRLPLVVMPSNRDNTTSKDARLVNCYMEKGQAEGEFYVYKRPGLNPSSQPSGGAATGYGTYNWNGDIYSIFGSTIYKNGSSIGTVDITNGVYRWTSTLGGTPRLGLGNGVKAYAYDGTTFAQISVNGTVVNAGSFIVGDNYTIAVIGSTDFTLIGAASNTVGLAFTATGVGTGSGNATLNSGVPTAFCKGWAYLDATTYLMTSNATIRGSNLNDITIWSPLNTIIAQIEPDGGVATGKQLVYVIAFKQWTTEVFYDAANSSGSPLSPVQGAKINYGCRSQDSVQDVGGQLIWIGTTREGSCQVILIDNLKAQVISTKPIERLLEGADYTIVYSWSLQREGHRFYVVTLKNSNLTLAYDLAEQSWSQWTDTNGNYMPIVASTYNSSAQTILQHESNGKLYIADAIYATDDGAIITADIYTPNFDAGVKARRKHLGRLTFVSDRYPGSVLQVRNNDRDYEVKAWTNFRPVDLNALEPQLNNCGTFYRRAYHFRHACATPLRIMAVELQLDLGII